MYIDGKQMHQLLEYQLKIAADNLLTLNVPIATKVICLSSLLKCLSNLYGKQCGPRTAGLQIYGGPESLSHDFKIWPITFQGSGPS